MGGTTMKEDGLFTKNELKILQELIDKSITQNDQMLNTITAEVKLIYEEQRFHYINIRKLIEEDIELKKWALGHEVFEGLTGMDVPSPIKHSPVMDSYRLAEDKCLDLFADIYGLSKPTP